MAVGQVSAQLGDASRFQLQSLLRDRLSQRGRSRFRLFSSPRRHAARHPLAAALCQLLPGP